MATTSNTPAVTEIPRINKNRFHLTIVGETPLITHKFSDTQKKQILDKQMKKAVAARKAKDPELDYRESMYYTPDGKPGFPASGIKGSCVAACSFLPKSVTKVWARGAFYIVGDILPIDGEPEMREDIVRIGGRSADLRYRAMFPEWIITFKVLHNPDIISVDGIINLVENAGFYVGIGDWRPQKSGTYGQFSVLKNGQAT